MREIIMWLPKDERRLLLAYYVNMFNIDDRNVCRYLDNPKWFEISDWIVVLRRPSWIPILTPWLVKRAAYKVKAYGNAAEMSAEEELLKNIGRAREEIKCYIRLEKRLKISNARLQERKFIRVQKHQHCDEVAGISLTTEGYDLARKYNSWWSRSNLWYSEYIKYHWICVVGSFVSGILATLLVQWLSG
jgi:hypothetical protein